MPYRLATDGGNCTVLLKMSFELGQRPCSEAQAQICRARGGRLDDQFLYVPSIDSRAARPFPIVQTGQAFGLKSLHPFVRVRVVKVGALACFPDAVACGQLPNNPLCQDSCRIEGWGKGGPGRRGKWWGERGGGRMGGEAAGRDRAGPSVGMGWKGPAAPGMKPEVCEDEKQG